MTEVAVTVGPKSLVGILHSPNDVATVGMVLVVGGPQYRVGSHRQFVLLARYLAAQGNAVLRFDHTGIGDSDGEVADFEAIGPDIRAAVDTLLTEQPQLKRVCLWGLCDAASALMMYAHTDARVDRLVLVNPWVRDADSLAAAQLKHYYMKSLFSAEFLKRLVRGEVNLLSSGRSLLTSLAAAVRRKLAGGDEVAASYQQRMCAGLAAFNGEVLIVISGQDLTASEFEDLVRQTKAWQTTLARPTVTRRYLEEADHTFSRRQWRDQVAEWTASWLA